MEKKDELFRKLDKRHEDHQAAKIRSREARNEAESKSVLEHLNDWTVRLSEKIDEEKVNKDMEHAQNILDEISDDMQKLDTYFIEHSLTLTKFDMKKIQESILDLRSKFNDLQNILIPKKRFGFKGNKKKAFENNSNNVITKVSQDQVDNKTQLKEFGYTVKNKSNETIELEHLNVESQDVMLTNLKNCTVVMKSNPITLHMTHLENCVLWMGPVQTSIYVDHCNDCQFSFACQQLRAHNSFDCKIYLHVTSKGIVEDCKRISVAPYNFSYEDMKEQFDKIGLDSSKNNWNQLDDFNWLASDQPSPNWNVIPISERVESI